MTERELIRRMLATLAYRLRKALIGAPESFADFSPGAEARTSLEILLHLTTMMIWIRTSFSGEFERPEAVEFGAEVERLELALAAVDRELAQGAESRKMTLEQILQGPMSDALTHAGQLALHRRLVGAPIEYENFSKADIRPGELALR